jgi:hypothetical protein
MGEHDGAEQGFDGLGSGGFSGEAKLIVFLRKHVDYLSDVLFLEAIVAKRSGMDLFEQFGRHKKHRRQTATAQDAIPKTRKKNRRLPMSLSVNISSCF